MSVRAIVAALVLALPAGALAQGSVRIDPQEAMQCAVWASIVSEQVTDEESKQGMLYALSYFVGQYEGATGNSVIQGHDDQAVIEVATNPDRFRPICMSHMRSFGPRMVEWGAVLTALGEEMIAKEGTNGK